MWIEERCFNKRVQFELKCEINYLQSMFKLQGVVGFIGGVRYGLGNRDKFEQVKGFEYYLVFREELM